MRRTTQLIGLAAIIAASISCGDVVRQGKAPVMLVIDALQAAQGNKPTALSAFLLSDVVVIVTQPAPTCSTDNPCQSTFNDVGSAQLRVVMKDVGTQSNPASPTTNNDVTITRVHIKYVRADGRNVPGVDVPYEWDAAATGTIKAGQTGTIGFEIVRHAAKEESPLIQLRNSPSTITTLTEVTIYGRDQVGNEIAVTGRIQIDFGNFGDS